MFETRACLVGATGMIGTVTMARASGRDDVALAAVTRREVPYPPGARVELLVGPTTRWAGLIATARAEVLACALGTTRAKVGTPEAFRAIDRDLVLACGEAARAAGIGRMIVVSAVGANAASRHLYLRTKGEMEQGLSRLGFARLDILRPAQLLGQRAERRPLERVAQISMRGMDLFLRGWLRRYHSICARDVADAILNLAGRSEPGQFVHEYAAILGAARGSA